jgi:peroxiredoxin
MPHRASRLRARGLALTTIVASVALGGALAGCGADAPDAAPPTADETTTATAPEPEDTATEEPSAGGSAGEADDQKDADADADKQAEPKQPPVPEILRFQAETVDGERFDGRSLAGRPAVLYFWAPWCPVCLREAPQLTALADGFGDDVAVVGVAGLSDDVAAMRSFVDSSGTQALTHLSDTDGQLYRRFGVTAQTTYGFVDASGAVTLVPGPLSVDQVRERVAAG